MQVNTKKCYSCSVLLWETSIDVKPKNVYINEILNIHREQSQDLLIEIMIYAPLHHMAIQNIGSIYN